MLGQKKIILLLSGKRGSGKDYVASALQKILHENSKLFWIGNVTKQGNRSTSTSSQ